MMIAVLINLVTPGHPLVVVYRHWLDPRLHQTLASPHPNPLLQHKTLHEPKTSKSTSGKNIKRFSLT